MGGVVAVFENERCDLAAIQSTSATIPLLMALNLSSGGISSVLRGRCGTVAATRRSPVAVLAVGTENLKQFNLVHRECMRMQCCSDCEAASHVAFSNATNSWRRRKHAKECAQAFLSTMFERRSEAGFGLPGFAHRFADPATAFDGVCKMQSTASMVTAAHRDVQFFSLPLDAKISFSHSQAFCFDVESSSHRLASSDCWMCVTDTLCSSGTIHFPVLRGS